jgi:hypothetical protein
MDELRDELERLASFALEECGEEACLAAITRALERVVTADDAEPLGIHADEPLAAEEASMRIGPRLVARRILEAVRLELFQLTRPHHSGAG